MSGVDSIVEAARIMEEREQGDNPGVRTGRFGQAETILVDPSPVRGAVDTVPVKGELAADQLNVSAFNQGRI
jgi:hypothetical protein